MSMLYPLNPPSTEDGGFIDPPTLVIPLAVWQELMGYVLACPVEINGFGYIDRVGNTFMLEKIFLLKQVATAGSVEVDERALVQYMTDALQRGENTGRIRFQWHSHVNMNAYFSGTDLDNISRYEEWMVSLVANKHGEFSARLDLIQPFRAWTPLEVQILNQPSLTLLEACRREINDKVSIQGAWRKRPVKPDLDSEFSLDASVIRNGGNGS